MEEEAMLAMLVMLAMPVMEAESTIFMITMEMDMDREDTVG